MTNNALKVDELIWRRIGDEIVIITPDGLATHILNKTAACVWELCDGQHGMPEMANDICQRFEVSNEQARADVDEVVGQLLGLGLVTDSVGEMNCG